MEGTAKPGILSEIKLRDLGAACLATARFDQTPVTPSDFARYGVPLPASVAGAVQKRQAEYLASRLLAAEAIRQKTGATRQVGTRPNRAPLWPAGLNGAITHSHGDCAVLLGDDNMLCGIDCEQVAGGQALAALRARCLSEPERRWVDTQTEHDPDRLATLIFSAKETIYKALYPVVQRFFGFEAAMATGWGEEEGILQMRLTEPIAPVFPKGFDLSIRTEATGAQLMTWLTLPRPDTGTGPPL